MASVVAEVDQFDATVTVPDDGDTRSAASVTAAGVGFQPLSNRTLYNKNRSIGALGGDLLLPLTGAHTVVNGAAAVWTYQVAAPNGTWVQSNIGGASEIYLQLPHVVGATCTGLVARVHGDPNVVGPHAGAVGTMPLLSLLSINTATGVAAVVGSQVDTTVAPATYEVIHDITLTVAAQTFSSTFALIAKLEGETGANSVASALHLYGITATIVAV